MAVDPLTPEQRKEAMGKIRTHQVSTERGMRHQCRHGGEPDPTEVRDVSGEI